MQIFTLVTVFLGCFVKSSIEQMNLASNGTTSQSSIYYWVPPYRVYLTSDLAVTGGPTNDFSSASCATTENGKYKAWWMLSFPSSTVYITDVKIYYRGNTPERLAGYYLYVTNTSILNASPKPPDADMCYHDVGPNLPSVNQSITCNSMGQNIVVYNDRNITGNKPNYSKTAYIELCDVQVLGCYKSWYGRYCNRQCSLKCFDKHCYPQNGTCVWGCNCLQESCDNTSICSNGCKKGFGGLYCLQNNMASIGAAIQHPHPGLKDASYAIDGDRSIDSCARTNGEDAWWQLDLKNHTAITAIYLTRKNNDDAKMKAEQFSLYVTFTSEIWRNSTPVNMTTDFDLDYPNVTYTANPVILGQFITYVPSKIDGTARLEICEVEVIGCPLRRYGPSCEKTCPPNCNASCHPVTGWCMFGCNDGWIGNRCVQSCSSPYFGPKCANICHCKNNKTCNFVNGTCPLGECAAGWEGLSCNEECKPGFYGHNCVTKCGDCYQELCDRFNGNCNKTYGCKPGFIGVKCDKECEDGYFGNCSSRCYCKMGSCDKKRGHCLNYACDKGWMGKTCSKECNKGFYGFDCTQRCSNCLNNTCDTMDGNCSYGCVQGFYGYQCSFSDLQLNMKTSDSFDVVPVSVGVIIVVLATVLIVSGGLLYRRRLKNTKSSLEKRSSVSRSNIYANIVNDENAGNKINEDDEQITCGFNPNTKANNEEQGNVVNSRSPYGNRLSEENTDVPRISEDIVYTNMAQKNQTFKIPVKQLAILIEEKRKNNNAGFENEYLLLPKGLSHRHTAATMENNKIKNRFLKTLPYDHSRVILEGDSDYINACYIDNYRKQRGYIASQGPKKNTVIDFWRMISQEGIETIVMLTRLEEERKKKCEQYWPEACKKSVKYGHITVSIAEEKRYTMCTYRQFEMRDTTKEEDRIVHQYHFVQWPDHGVPDTVKLVNFYRKVKRTISSVSVPLLVHCSAGVGRTGTFIAIDSLYEYGLETGFVDVFDCAQMMRKDRVDMIQTLEQYVSVYEALLELFTVPVTTVDADTFCSYMDIQDSKQVPKNQSIFRQQFQKLQDLVPVYARNCFKAAMFQENVHKNVSQEMLPHDKFRPFLMSIESARNDFINAVIIPTYKENQQIFVTQYPLSDTTVDFWTMVYDFDCTTVVLLEDMNQDVPLWPRQGCEFNLGKLYLKNTGTFGADVSLVLQFRETEESRRINVFTLTDWTAENLPISVNAMLILLQKISVWQVDQPGNIAAVCRDGCYRSGLFAALTLILDKVETDDEVDIFQVVRSLQIRRPQFFKHFKQYEFCYRCTKEYINGKNGAVIEESLYANT